MALTAGDVALWTNLAQRGLIPAAPRVLEIGQANWYGDMAPPEGCEDECLFAVARKWYRKVLGYSAITAVDRHGPDAQCLDLNEPLSLGEFDIVINTGTAEHVFDQRQLMETIHDHCAPGGLMIHAAPWKGWDDHGFYCYQPCFFKDLAAANDYETLYSTVWKFGQADTVLGTIIYIALRKTRALPFRVPIQGRYRKKEE